MGGKINNFKIQKTVHYLPDNIVTNIDLTRELDTSDEWISSRTGIKARRIEKNLSLLEMTKKALAMLNDAELSNIDGIICATCSNEYTIPSLACQVAKEIEVKHICTDINNACSGFIYALHLANGLFKTDEYKKILLISAEKMSSVIDPTDRTTAIIFGDAVTVTILEATRDIHLLSQHIHTNGSIDELHIQKSNFLQMNGQDVFRFAIRSISKCLKMVDLNEVDYFVFHQANKRIIEAVVKKFNLDTSKVIINIEQYGNTSSASIPLILSENEFKKDDKIFLCAFGAGLSYGYMLYQI